MTNPYATAPLCVAQIDPVTKQRVRAFFFLGTVPRAVLSAAQRGAMVKGDPRQTEWSPRDKEILSRHYGPHWRDLLTATDPPDPEPLGIVSNVKPLSTWGGSGDWPPGDGSGDWPPRDGPGDWPQFADPTARPPGTTGPGPAPEAQEYWTTGSGPPVYSDTAVYPEDTIFDLRLKLQLVSGVPPYRQHLFYYFNGEGPNVPYSIVLDEIPIPIDWRLIRAKAESSRQMAGIVIDPRLEERREGVKVEAYDTFVTLSPAPSVHVTHAYFIDLYDIVPPLSAAERPPDDLSAVLRDRYQFDLLYYGGILQYWPQLSPDACLLALSDPARVGDSYPLLAPARTALRERFDLEQKFADLALSWRPEAAKGARSTIAVTAATVRVLPEAIHMRVSVRNVFDWIPTSPSIAASVVHFDVEPTTSGPGGPSLVTAAKRQISSYGPRSAAAIDRFLARVLRRGSTAFALSRGADDVSETAGEQFMFMVLFSDGRYEVTAGWREDDRMGFEAVTGEVANVVTPVVDSVNGMGVAAFPIGGSLAPVRGKRAHSSVSLGALTASAFWPHALTSASFQELRDRFRLHERARIILARGLQESGAFTFFFRKGIVAYDPRLAARAEAGRTDPAEEGHRPRLGVSNQYAWLTDPSVMTRWAAYFQGRTVRIHHRITDLRVEIVNTDSLAEFELIRRYVFSFLDDLLREGGPKRIKVGDVLRSREEAAMRRLRRLQERDPNLFDLKKYDQDATVYSVLCQSGRQPYVYSEREARDMDPKRRAQLVKYWNFTENAPAYYECPSAKYPHLSFRAGQHPLGYCLPCCKKVRPVAGSRAALVNEKCLGRKVFTADESAVSRHVLAYGKQVPVGRLSDAPRDLAEGLLLDTLPPPYTFCLIGVEQSAPAVPNAGFAYALAYAAGAGDSSASDVLSGLAGVATSMGDAFYALGEGGGAAFPSARDLADAIISAFVRRDGSLSAFGPGGNAEATWTAILTDLARHAYGVEVVVASDAEGTGSVTLEATAEAAMSIVGRGICPGFVRPRVIILVTGPAGTYPVVALDPKVYQHAAPSGRWMAVRRTFAFVADRSDATFVTDRVAELIREALAAYLPQTSGVLDLALVSRFICAGGHGWSVDSRLVNMRDMCYGVLIRADVSGAGRVYIPVRHSTHFVDGTPTIYGSRPKVPLPKELLDRAVADLNGYIGGSGEPFSPVGPTAGIVNKEGQLVGFAHSVGEAGTLYFYHDPVPAGASGAGPRAVYFPYDSRDVDAAITGWVQGDRAPPELSAKAAAARSRNRMYRLVLAEFSALVNEERNQPLRKALAEAIEAAHYSSPGSVIELGRKIVKLLRDYPNDLRKVRDAISRAYTTSPRNLAKAAVATIGATAFDFDRQLLERLRALGTHVETVAAVRKLMSLRYRSVAASEAADADNIYVSCAADTSVAKGQCADGRLRIPKDRLEDFYDILAADIRNTGKTGLISAVSAGVFEPLSFIRRPGERLIVSVDRQ